MFNLQIQIFLVLKTCGWITTISKLNDSQNNVFLLLSDSDYRNLNTDSVKAEVQIKAIVQGKSGKG